MGDDKKKKKLDDKLISLKEPYEVAYWTKALGVSKAQLTKLVAEHSDYPAKIRKVLGKT